MRRLDRLVKIQRQLGFESEAGLVEQDIDPNVYSLLILMNVTGNQTFASCGGHTNGRLKCWIKEDTGKDLKYGGYIDFEPTSIDLVTNLEQYLKHFYPLKKNVDVWIDRTFGVGLKHKKDGWRVSWYFKSYGSNRKLIHLLEAFFIDRIEELKKEEAGTQQSPQ